MAKKEKWVATLFFVSPIGGLKYKLTQALLHINKKDANMVNLNNHSIRIFNKLGYCVNKYNEIKFKKC